MRRDRLIRCLLSAVLALSTCMPGGAIRTIAQGGESVAEAGVARGSSVPVTERSQEVTDADESPAEGEQAIPADGGQVQAAVGDSQATATRAGPDNGPTTFTCDPKRTPVELQSVITGIVTGASLTDVGGNAPVKNIGAWQAFQLHVRYSLPSTTHAGDTTTIELLPKGIVAANPTSFDIKDGANVIAHVRLVPGNTGQFMLTYTDYVDHKSPISGEFQCNIQIDNNVLTEAGDIDVSIKVGDDITPAGTVGYRGSKVETPKKIIKSGWTDSGNPRRAVWQIKLNQDHTGFANAKLDDVLQEPGVSYLPYTLEVYTGKWVLEGVSYKLKNEINVTSLYRPKASYNGTRFTLDLGDIPADTGLLIRYRTEISYDPVAGEKFSNLSTLTSGGTTLSSLATYSVTTAGGSGEGPDFSIMIQKSDDAGAPLAGARFDVIRERTGLSVGQITTDATGQGTLGNLVRDKYILRETFAPAGYQKAEDETVLATDFGPNKKATKTIVDRRATTIDVAVRKMWDDADNQDGLRPASITVRLLADGVDTGRTLTIAGDSWQDSFTGLDRTNAAGDEIAYSVTESPTPTSYTSAVSGSAAVGFTITNRHVPETSSVKVTKAWVGTEGGPVTVHLLADGIDTGKTLTLSAGGWTGTFSDLPKYRDHGMSVAYTVFEDPVPGYSSAISGDAASGFTITNTRTTPNPGPGTVTVSGTKTWDDGGDRDGVRPRSITVRLHADGIEVDSRTVSAADSWAYAFPNRPRYTAGGTAITYTITEDAVEGYATSVNGFNITNRRAQGQTSVTATKLWDDDNDRDGRRPATVQLQLYANGNPSGSAVTLGPDSGWTHSWTTLPKAEGGRDIAYSVRELAVPGGYTSEVSGDATRGFTITNRHTPETVSIPIVKRWVGHAGPAVTIRLLADGIRTDRTLVLDAAASWKGSFRNLPKYRDHGTPIAYAVSEDAIDGYASKVSGDAADGFTVTNTAKEESNVTGDITNRDTEEAPGSPGSGRIWKPAGDPRRKDPTDRVRDPGLPQTEDTLGSLLATIPLLVLAAVGCGTAAIALRRRQG